MAKDTLGRLIAAEKAARVMVGRNPILTPNEIRILGNAASGIDAEKGGWKPIYRDGTK